MKHNYTAREEEAVQGGTPPAHRGGGVDAASPLMVLICPRSRF